MNHNKFNRRNFMKITSGSILSTGLISQTVAADDDLIYSEDFENYSVGDVPANIVMAGNRDQKITNNTAAEGGQSYRQSGSHGGCWRALARIPVEIKDEITVRGYYKFGQGSSGCHTGCGEVVLRTVASSSWSAGKGVNLLRFYPDGTVESAGTEVGSYDTSEWTKFEVKYVREKSKNEVTHYCKINGGEEQSVNRQEAPHENKLSVFGLRSNDFTVFWDNLSIKSGASTEPSIPTEFENLAETKLSLANDIDDLAVVLSEVNSVEDLLDDHRQAFRDGRYSNEELPNDAVIRLLAGERVTGELLLKTGPAGSVQLSERTIDFSIKLATSIAMMGISFTDLVDADLGNLGLSDQIEQLVLSDIDGLVEESLQVMLPPDLADKAVVKVWGAVEEIYEQIMSEEIETSNEFNQAVSDGISRIIADLTIQRQIEIGGVNPISGGIPETIFDNYFNVERSLERLNTSFSPESITENGLQGDFDGVQNARGSARDNIETVANTTDLFLEELENRLQFVNIFDNVYTLVTGFRDGRPLWRIFGTVMSLVTNAGLATATVRAIGITVGRHAIRLLMAIHARGHYGIEQGELITFDDLLEILPDEDEILAELDEIAEEFTLEGAI